MRYRILALFSTCLIASVVAAQSAPAPAGQSSDSWAKPATASSSVSYRDGTVLASKPNPSRSPFTFKNTERFYPVDQPPPSAMDKASVPGTDRPWQNGQPPVDCAGAPHSSECRQ